MQTIYHQLSISFKIILNLSNLDNIFIYKLQSTISYTNIWSEIIEQSSINLAAIWPYGRSIGHNRITGDLKCSHLSQAAISWQVYFLLILNKILDCIAVLHEKVVQFKGYSVRILWISIVWPFRCGLGQRHNNLVYACDTISSCLTFCKFIIYFLFWPIWRHRHLISHYIWLLTFF